MIGVRCYFDKLSLLCAFITVGALPSVAGAQLLPEGDLLSPPAPAAAPGPNATGSTDASGSTNASADAFGLATPAFKLNGFFDTVGAYTYASPEHWSEGVARLQLVGEGSLSGDVKYKIGGRIDYDPVYARSDFYLSDVRSDERLNFFHGENYLDFSKGNWNFRLGAQQIVWGEVAGLFFADVVSAKDEREFLLPSFDIIRIPQWAARAEYFSGDSHLEFVWIPVPEFDNIGKPGADFYPVPLPSPTPASVAAMFHDPVEPARTLANSNVGVRANTLVDGWDIAGFYYRSSSSAPTFYRTDTGIPSSPFVFTPRYDRIWQAGGTVSKDMGSFVLRAETVYTHGRGYSVADLFSSQSVEHRASLDTIVGVEWMLAGNTRVDIQGFDRSLTGGGDDTLSIKSAGTGATISVASKVTPTLEPQIQWIQSFEHAGGLIRPRLNWSAAKNTVIAFGVDVFAGPQDGFFGEFHDRSRVYVEARLDF